MITTPSFIPPQQRIQCTLAPLVALGADALAPDLELGVKGVFLQEYGAAWENVYGELVVRRAGDVFACAKAAGSQYDVLPRGARPVYAVLRFHVTGAGQPYFAEIWPPYILTLSPGYAAELMKCWLAAHGFIVAAQVNPPGAPVISPTPATPATAAPDATQVTPVPDVTPLPAVTH